jgi:hypothetical protein
MLKRRTLSSFFDVAGGVAGAAFVLASILLFVAVADATHKAPQTVIAAALLPIGLALMFVRGLTNVRIIFGAILVVLFVASIVTAIFIPGLHRL